MHTHKKIYIAHVYVHFDGAAVYIYPTKYNCIVKHECFRAFSISMSILYLHSCMCIFYVNVNTISICMYVHFPYQYLYIDMDLCT